MYFLRCSCGYCTSMPSATECKRCRSIPMEDSKIQTSDVDIQCITDHEGFQANCLNRHVIEVSYMYYEFVQDNGLPEEPVHELYRYIAYRRFARWIWSILGKRNRRVLPACVVTQIRSNFSSQEYCGFQYPGRHLPKSDDPTPLGYVAWTVR
ncbi:hypothetical protein FSP39_023418 [Pinctada imbricata]|uniref:P2X purinoreceptor 7 intracellular domain-containing protein n=1 Tax=Pinctada imbricata TaxID=66713 RepID=A0AA88XMT5_PINIB|nr:hypothetical protein FSP39_023418 [Pinctada imbricata]